MHVAVGASEVLANVGHGGVVKGLPDKVDVLPEVVHRREGATGALNLRIAAAGGEVVEDESNKTEQLLIVEDYML